jgi:hypothetical protein
LGATRLVLLIGPLALKLPRPSSWRGFLHGLLSNLQERRFAAARWPELCPVLWADPWGLLVVMPRADPAPKLSRRDYLRFTKRPDYTVPVEHKTDSFGLLDGHLVAIDYGS